MRWVKPLLYASLHNTYTCSLLYTDFDLLRDYDLEDNQSMLLEVHDELDEMAL